MKDLVYKEESAKGTDKEQPQGQRKFDGVISQEKKLFQEGWCQMMPEDPVKLGWELTTGVL